MILRFVFVFVVSLQLINSQAMNLCGISSTSLRECAQCDFNSTESIVNCVSVAPTSRHCASGSFSSLVPIVSKFENSSHYVVDFELLSNMTALNSHVLLNLQNNTSNTTTDPEFSQKLDTCLLCPSSQTLLPGSTSIHNCTQVVLCD